MPAASTTAPPAAGRRSGWWYVGGAVALTVLGVVMSTLLALPAVLLGAATLETFVLSVVLGEAGFVAAAAFFVLITDRGLAYVDRGLPGSWGLVAAVILGAFVFRTVVVAGAVALGLDPSPPSLVDAPIPVETLLAVMIPASILVVGPAEELLFRGTIQKYLRERFAATGAILGAGLLFAVVHVPTLVVTSGPSAALSLGVILLVGLSFGWLYERTGSLVAAMVAHGGYNALIFGSGLVLTRLV
ncbi:CPBP family intramembrane glutamic endopeptidase [Haloglomus litoreum]|uniref:CPBP family intramembrane glutamic endopeptidase n=1 Tax=Haloglomus litoreum TaxID=3034026 RepID=UPI0023E85598|nr:type II CAAX endopeptidase family protein [Haloglomus sp. DT116]